MKKKRAFLSELLQGNNGKYSLCRFSTLILSLCSFICLIVAIIGIFIRLPGWELFLAGFGGGAPISVFGKTLQKRFEGEPGSWTPSDPPEGGGL